MQALFIVNREQQSKKVKANDRQGQQSAQLAYNPQEQTENVPRARPAMYNLI